MTSRRVLLGGFAAVSVCSGAVSVAQAAQPEVWSQTYDVIVVGGGAAGLAAAVAAAQKKASVCLVEKLPMLGGDTLRSTGYFSCVEPRRQKLNGVEDSLENHFRQTMRAGDNLADPRIVRRMVEEAPKTVAWLEACGVLFQDSVYEIYGSDHRRCLKPVLPRGTAYIRALSQTAMSLGVKIMLETRLSDLHLDAQGRTLGVTVGLKTGLSMALRARKGVVLASGGFGANAEMVARYAPQLAGLPTDNSPGSTGDALLIAQKLGIKVEGLSYVECVAGNPPGRKTHARLFLPADFVMINENGKRFVEEDALRLQLTQAILQQPNRRCFTVFDRQGVERLDPISQKGLYQALVADEALSAKTLEELARQMRVPVNVFETEIERYNRLALIGESRGNRRNLPGKCSRVGCTPLIEPPFWAYEVGLTVHYTPGGISVNELGEVLKTDGTPVPGLWAAGEVTGSVHGANRLGGNGLTDALTFGRLTGEAAAQSKELNF